MILDYNYWWFKSAIPADVCNQIIELGLTTMHEQKEQYGADATNATVGGWVQKNEKLKVPVNDATISDLEQEGINIDETYVRDSNVTFLNNPSLYELVWPFIHEANKNAGWNFQWDYTENFQFTKYGVGQFYGWHTDDSGKPYELFDQNIHDIQVDSSGSPILDMFGQKIPKDMHLTSNENQIGKIRKISVTISLNDPSEYDGGNLKFDLGPHRSDRYHECEEIRPQGSVIVFPSFIQHQVTPVTRGTRYSLVCWNLGNFWK